MAQAFLACATITTGLRGLVVRPVLMAAELAGPGSTWKGEQVLMARESPSRECHESGPQQGRMKDHRVRRLGEILKQVLNKASPAAAITLCN